MNPVFCCVQKYADVPPANPIIKIINHNNQINNSSDLQLIILFSRFAVTNQNQLIMGNINTQWVWEYAVKRIADIADPKLKAEDCKT